MRLLRNLVRAFLIILAAYIASGIVFILFSSFPLYMRKVHGRRVGWRCEVCRKSFFDGWLIEFHHKLPTVECKRRGIEPDTYDNIEARCTECHYNAHVDLRNAGLDHPYSATLVLERLRKTGGRVNPERVRQTSPQYQY